MNRKELNSFRIKLESGDSVLFEASGIYTKEIQRGLKRLKKYLKELGVL